MSAEVIERKAVNALQNFIDDMGMKTKVNICCNVQSNDKTKYTDGFIRIDNKTIEIQIKGKKNTLPKYSIDKKYYDYAKENLLLFIVVVDVFDKEEIYYEFMSRSFLEMKLKGKSHQKTISHEFSKKLTPATFNEFCCEFEEEFKNRDKGKVKTIEDVSCIPKIQFNGSLNYSSDVLFYDQIEFQVKELVDRETNLKYEFESSNTNIALFAKKQKMPINIYGKEEQVEVLSEPHRNKAKINLSPVSIVIDFDNKLINISIDSFTIWTFKIAKSIIVAWHLLSEMKENIEINENVDISENDLHKEINLLFSTAENYNSICEQIGYELEIPIKQLEEINTILTMTAKYKEEQTIMLLCNNVLLFFTWDKGKYRFVSLEESWKCIITKDKQQLQEINGCNINLWILLNNRLINKNIENKISFLNKEIISNQLDEVIDIFMKITDDEKEASSHLIQLCINLICIFDSSVIKEETLSQLFNYAEKNQFEELVLYSACLLKKEYELGLKQKEILYGLTPSNLLLTKIRLYILDEVEEAKNIKLNDSEYCICQTKVIESVESEVNNET